MILGEQHRITCCLRAFALQRMSLFSALQRMSLFSNLALTL